MFLYRGKLHIIPPKLFDDAMSLEQAAKVVRQCSSETVAPSAVQQLLENRLKSFRTETPIGTFISKTIIPRDIARVLIEQPQWVSRAVEAFYTRDMLSMRHCQNMNYFHPQSVVVAKIKFTKHLYAQLASQRQTPPKPFTEISSLKRLLVPSPIDRQKFPKEIRWADIGMKLSLGFETLMTDPLYALSDLADVSFEVIINLFGQTKDNKNF